MQPKDHIQLHAAAPVQGQPAPLPWQPSSSSSPLKGQLPTTLKHKKSMPQRVAHTLGSSLKRLLLSTQAKPSHRPQKPKFPSSASSDSTLVASPLSLRRSTSQPIISTPQTATIPRPSPPATPAKSTQHIEQIVDLLLDTPDRTTHGYVDSSRGCKIYYEVYGAGTHKLFLIMGMIGTTTYWVRQTRHFARLGYTVCVFDNRGSGRSTVSRGPYKVSQLARDARAVLDALNWHSDIHMVGVSLGGMVAQELCLAESRFATVTFVDTWQSSALALPTAKEIRFAFTGMSPRALVSLVFARGWVNAPFGCGSAMTNGEVLVRMFDRIQVALSDYRSASSIEPARGQTASEPPPSLALESSCPRTAPGRTESVPLKPREHKASARWEEVAGNLHQFVACLGHRLSASKVKEMRRRNPQTRFFVVHGAKDKVIRPACGRALAKNLGCPFIMIEGAGHMPLIDTYGSFNSVIGAVVESSAWFEELPDRARVDRDTCEGIDAPFNVRRFDLS